MSTEPIHINAEIAKPPTSQTLYYDVDGVLLNFVQPFTEHWNQGVHNNAWSGPLIPSNPHHWSFKSHASTIVEEQLIDDQVEVFYYTHDHLPLMHESVVDVLRELSGKFVIELVTAYPYPDRRVQNLAHHGLPYHYLTCNVRDKLAHIQQREQAGYPVAAIFEDGPHNLRALLPVYGGKVWAPRQWNYLQPLYTDQRIRFYDHPHEWRQV